MSASNMLSAVVQENSIGLPNRPAPPPSPHSSSESKVAPSVGAADAASRLEYVYKDIPCLNCGRYGVIQGQMIINSENNTFCSADCGWSYWLRPLDRQQAPKTTRVVSTRRRSTRRPSRSSKTANNQAGGPTQSSSRRPGHHSRDVSDSRHAESRHGKSERATARQNKASVPSSSKRPPRHPRSSTVASDESSSSRFSDSGNAMFDFCMHYFVDE